MRGRSFEQEENLEQSERKKEENQEKMEVFPERRPGKQPQSAASSSELARKAMVSNYLQSPRGASLVPPQETGPPLAIGRADLASYS
ncbi:unnamed protein product [Merluccius merluccius]